jgi:hypothetical protein
MVEVTIVALVVGIAVAVSVPFIARYLQVYRLGIATQQIADSLQATKMRAVAKTRRLELLFDVPGNRLGVEGAELQPLPSGVVFSAGGVTVAPMEGVEMGEPVTFPAAGGAPGMRAASFTGRGLPDADPGEVFGVFVTNGAGTRVVTMTSAGNVQVYEWMDGAWS